MLLLSQLELSSDTTWKKICCDIVICKTSFVSGFSGCHSEFPTAQSTLRIQSNMSIPEGNLWGDTPGPTQHQVHDSQSALNITSLHNRWHFLDTAFWTIRHVQLVIATLLFASCIVFMHRWVCWSWQLTLHTEQQRLTNKPSAVHKTFICIYTDSILDGQKTMKVLYSCPATSRSRQQRHHVIKEFNSKVAVRQGAWNALSSS